MIETSLLTGHRPFLAWNTGLLIAANTSLQWRPQVSQHGPGGQLGVNESQVARQLNRSTKGRPRFGQHQRRKTLGR